MQRRPHVAVLALLGLLVALALAAPAAEAVVSPQEFAAELEPGQSVTVTKSVDVPDVPRSIDVMLVVDLTGSYSNDLPRIKALAPGIFDAVRATSPNSRFGLATHVDFPFSPWGSSQAEWGYRLEQQLTADRATWLAAVNAMTSLIGNDEPESQYEALYQVASGAGRQMPNTTDGDYDDLGEIRPGQQGDYRDSAIRILAITTDSSFHNAGDPGPFPYPGPSRQTVLDALAAASIRVVAIKAPGSTAQMDDVAAATFGQVTFTDNTSSQIGEAITNGIAAFRYAVRGVPEDCAPLQVTLDPPQLESPGNVTVQFTETIKVPEGITAADLPPGGVVRCGVRFRGGRASIGAQGLTITVVLNKPPVCSAVTATPNTLWPANHQLERVQLGGATDPDGDPVALKVTGVQQDEPVNGLGDGDKSPDAVSEAAGNAVSLRSERSGTEDGRVYTIAFEGSDGRGGTCTGTATVSVPKNQSTRGAAVASGGSFDSFGS